jgi:hypothetical protein
METIFLILSGVILAAGVLYWFWSHIQLTQKKVQLLENAVFELRGLMTRGDPGTESRVPAPLAPPAPVYQDLADDEEDWPAPAPVKAASADIGSTPLSALSGDATADLQPGGRLEVPSPSSPEKEKITTDDQFRELFLQRSPAPTPPAAASASAATEVHDEKTVSTGPAAVVSPVAVSNEALEAMPVKDLRRLAEQRGLTGVSEMRKKEILSALRQQIPAAAAGGKSSVAVASEPQPSTTVVVERTLDLTEADGIEEATVLE